MKQSRIDFINAVNSLASIYGYRTHFVDDGRILVCEEGSPVPNKFLPEDYSEALRKNLERLKAFKNGGVE